MGDQIDPDRFAVGQQDQGVHQAVAGKLGAVPVVEIGRELPRRGPGVMDEDRLQAEIIDDLGVQVEPVGKGRVETVHENEDVAFGKPHFAEIKIEVAGEVGAAVIIKPAGQREFGRWIGATAGIVDLAGQAVVRHPDIGAGKVQREGSAGPEMCGRIVRGLPRGRDVDGMDRPAGLTRIQHGQARRRGGTTGHQHQKGQDERRVQDASHGFPLVRADLGQAVRCVKGRVLVHLEGETSNALFETLADWDHQLKHADIDFEEPQP